MVINTFIIDWFLFCFLYKLWSRFNREQIGKSERKCIDKDDRMMLCYGAPHIQRCIGGGRLQSHLSITVHTLCSELTCDVHWSNIIHFQFVEEKPFVFFSIDESQDFSRRCSVVFGSLLLSFDNEAFHTCTITLCSYYSMDDYYMYINGY